MAWVNTNTDSKGNSSIGTDATMGKASLGDRESKRVVTKSQGMPARVNPGSMAKKVQRQGQ